MKHFIDLFCGIGGFHLALAARGMHCVFASDKDKKCREVYEANFGLKPDGDITKVDPADIPAHDVLCGGFPCQPFSRANRGAKGFGDTRGTLFFDVARIIDHHKPKIVLLENVPHIINVDGGNVMATILRTLEDLGYRTAWHKLNAADFGCATARLRVYFVAIRNDLDLISNPPVDVGERDCVANHLRLDLDTKDLEKPLADYRFGKHGNPLSNPQGTKLLGRKKGATRNHNQSGGRVYDIDGAFPTFLATGKAEAVYIPPRPDNRARQVAKNKECGPECGPTGSKGRRAYDPAHPAPTFTTAGRNEFPFTEGFVISRPVRLGNHKDRENTQGYRFYSADAPAATITARGGGQMAHTEGYFIEGVIRRLHIEEAKTIQGYPPEHILSPGVAGYKQIGNSVIPRMVGLVYDAIGEGEGQQGLL